MFILERMMLIMMWAMWASVLAAEFVIDSWMGFFYGGERDEEDEI